MAGSALNVALPHYRVHSALVRILGAFHYAKLTGQRSMEYPREMERRFPIKPGLNQKEWLLPFFIPFPNYLIRAKKQLVKNGTANFGRNIPTGQSGPTLEGDPEYSGRKKPKRTSHLNSDRKFRNLWHSGKHPLGGRGVVPVQRR